VHVGLGYTNHPRQSAFGKFTVANSFSKLGDESLLDIAEGHDGLAAIFPREIGGYPIRTYRFRETIIKQKEFSEPKFSRNGFRLIALVIHHRH